MLARTIVQFLFLISRTIIHEGVLPKSSSLQYLYEENLTVKRLPNELSMLSNKNPLLAATFRLFSGLSAGLSWPTRTAYDALAFAEGGLCAYYSVLDGLTDDPARLGFVNIILGHLTHEGTRYRGLCDPAEDLQVQENFDLRESNKSCSAQLVADDNTFDMILRAKYQILAQDLTLVGHVRMVELINRLLHMPPYSKCAGGQSDSSCTPYSVSEISGSTIKWGLSRLRSNEAPDTVSRIINSMRNGWVCVKHVRKISKREYTVEIMDMDILRVYSWLSGAPNHEFYGIGKLTEYPVTRIHQSCNVCLVKKMALHVVQLEASQSVPGDIPLRFVIKSAGSTMKAPSQSNCLN